ncbi:MAG: hypothetical protein MUE97_04805, partial [Phycisphaerales bacterium]|nr:hypothetical protein [Phycisphaerales bacterium]
MLSRLTGTLESIDGQVAVLRPAGPLGEAVSFEVLLPAYLATRLSTRIGESITIRAAAYLQAEGQGTSFTPQILGF